MGVLSTSDAVPRRLSKPRTKSSTTVRNSALNRDVDISSPPISTTPQDYFGDYPAVVSSQGERRSRRKSRSRIRAYLHGPDSESMQTSSDEDDGQATLSGAARDVRARISRTGSSIMQLQSAKTSTTRLSNASSSRLLLNGSRSSDAEESAMVAGQIKERAYHDNLAAQNHIASPIDEDKHVDSVMAPLRRKSLYTPGLATRHPSDILKKPPVHDASQSQPDRDYYYDPTRPKESPLSQLAALQLAEDGRSTPSNMNYAQLGGLQLGTLRVTNASPIPRNRTPDPVCTSPASEPKTQDEYYTASEGSIAGDLSALVLPRAGSPLRFGSKNQPSARSDCHGSMTPRRKSPLETSDLAASMADEYMSELGRSPFTCSEQPSSRGIGSTEDSFIEDEELVVPQAEGAAAEVWRQFIHDAELRHGEKGSQEDAFRKLNGNTPSSMECRRLSASHSLNWRYSISSTVPKIDSGYASNASLNANQPKSKAGTAASRSQSPKSVHETTQAAPQSSNGATDFGLVPAKIDQASLQGTAVPPNFLIINPDHESRCISGPRDMPQSIPEHGRYSLQLVGPAPKPSSFSVIPQNKTDQLVRPTARSSTITRKLQKARPKSHPRPVDLITVQGFRELSSAHIPRVPSIVAARHADRLRKFPLLDHTFPSLDHTTPDDIVSPNTAYDGPFPVPIRFPSPANAPEAATMNDPTTSTVHDDGQKSPSRAVSDSRQSTQVPVGRRISSFKALPKRRESIVVEIQDDLWPAPDIVRSPSWSNIAGGRRTKEQKRLAKQDKDHEKRLVKEEKILEKRLGREEKDLERQNKRGAAKQTSSRSQSVSRTRARSSERSSRNSLATVADFGTVTESLGGNPYDIATVMFPPPCTSPKASSRYPHQISSGMSRTKSSIGMDEVAATDFHRARSRDRSQSVGRPSFADDKLPGNQDAVFGRRSRPQTMFADVPPMPALAAVDLKTHDLVWSRTWQRSQSNSEARAPSIGPLNDRGCSPGRSIEPHSTVMETPPVPALPSAEQVRQREAQITMSRPQSMVIETPSMPALPALSVQPVSKRASVSEGDVELEGSFALRPEMLVRPRKTKTSNLVPNLWSSGSLEKKGTRATQKPEVVEVTFDTSSSEETPPTKEDSAWEAQLQAWRLRRQSAGEALLRNQSTEIFDNRPTEEAIAIDEMDIASTLLTAVDADSQGFVRSKQFSRPVPSFAGLPNPLASHPVTRQQKYEPVSSGSSPSGFVAGRPSSYLQSSPHLPPRPGPSPLTHRHAPTEDQTQVALPDPAQRHASIITIPRKRIGSGTSTPTKPMDRLTGRYDGGLLYGYEPGCGLGGSAGTRGTNTEASRKSVDVSRGFGLDLSDVPIFVAPTPAR